MAAVSAVVSSSPHHSRRPSRVANTSAHDLETVSNPGDAIGAAQQADVYPLLRLISHDIRITIDTALSYEELIGHELNFAIVRPLAVKYARLKSPAVLYALLVTRTHFLKEAERDLAYQGMNTTRAELCEILACKLLRTFSRDSMDLVAALCVALWPYTGADDETIDNAKRQYGEKTETRSTLLLAIQSSAKRFTATPLVQKVVDGIWEGQIVLGTTSTSRALIDDSYKIHPVSFYDPATAPFLDWHRLRVPKIRAFLDGANFVIVLILYVYCLRAKDQSKWSLEETLFSTWLIGITIGELAQMAEHGAETYFSSLFNVIDCVFVSLDRPHGLHHTLTSLSCLPLCPPVVLYWRHLARHQNHCASYSRSDTKQICLRCPGSWFYPPLSTPRSTRSPRQYPPDGLAGDGFAILQVPSVGQRLLCRIRLGLLLAGRLARVDCKYNLMAASEIDIRVQSVDP